jgi:hypothetical protein
MIEEKQSFRKYVELFGPMPHGRKHQRILFTDVANAMGLSKRQLRKVTTTRRSTFTATNMTIDAVKQSEIRQQWLDDVVNPILESYIDASKEANR